MALPGFIFGGDTGIHSPEELARARAYAEALLGPQRPAQNVGEGLAVLGQAIRGRREMNAVNKASAAGDASASSAIAQALGGSGSFPPAPGGGASPVASALSGGAPQSASATPPISGSGDTEALMAAFNDPAKRSRLPAGMRNNNPGNIKFVGQAGTHPSQNTDQGDPQAVYDSPESGMRAMYGLLGRKYAGGKTTANAIIAGNGGWTPGNFQAAANVARNAGLRPDQDINFNDPQMAAKFMRGLMLQEHGEASKLYPDSLILSAIGGQPPRSPALAAVNAEAGAPQQVASLDPAVGMPPAPSPVSAALQLPAQGPIPQARPDVAAALNGAPQLPNPGPGDPAATTPAGQRVLGQMMSPLPMGGNAMQMQPPAGAVPAPTPAPAAHAQQTAQAQPNLDQIPVEAGGNAGTVQPGGLPSVQQLMQAAQNPWLKPEQRQLINGLLAQKMKQSDPAALLEMEKNRLDMEKTRIETERLRNPQMSPAEKARLDLDTQKFDADQKKLMELSPGTTVFDPATRAPVYSAPKDAAKPAGIAEYEYAKEQGFPGTFQDWEASKKGGMSFQTNPDGTVTFQQGGNIKPMTEGQSKDTTFATRAAGALPLVDKYGDALTSFGGNLAANGGALGNYMKSPEYQQAEQAGKEFLQAILRKDTGAAITSGETTEYGSVYLPRPGDSPELLAQKKQSRTRALEAMKAGMTPQAILAQEKATAASAAPPAVGAPQAGTVEDGYRFKGGDPADQSNWEPAQ